ncbi:MAG: hypothetical protein AAFU71_04370, partial [Cyanobacteria bacterium J06632_22]
MAPYSSSTTQTAQRLTVHRLLSTLLASLTASCFVVIYCVSYAAILFNGRLAPFMSRGIGLLLFSAVVVGTGVATLSSYRGAIAAPQNSTAAILAVITGGL